MVSTKQHKEEGSKHLQEHKQPKNAKCVLLILNKLILYHYPISIQFLHIKY